MIVAVYHSNPVTAVAFDTTEGFSFATTGFSELAWQLRSGDAHAKAEFTSAIEISSFILEIQVKHYFQRFHLQIDS